MSAHRITDRTLTTAAKVRRVLAVLSVVLALVANPTFSPSDAGAMLMFVEGARRECRSAGGSVTSTF